MGKLDDAPSDALMAACAIVINLLPEVLSRKADAAAVEAFFRLVASQIPGGLTEVSRHAAVWDSKMARPPGHFPCSRPEDLAFMQDQQYTTDAVAFLLERAAAENPRVREFVARGAAEVRALPPTPPKAYH